MKTGIEEAETLNDVIMCALYRTAITITTCRAIFLTSISSLSIWVVYVVSVADIVPCGTRPRPLD